MVLPRAGGWQCRVSDVSLVTQERGGTALSVQLLLCAGMGTGWLQFIIPYIHRPLQEEEKPCWAALYPLSYSSSLEFFSKDSTVLP